MTGIGTAIEWTNQMTIPLFGIVNALNLAISAFQNMQDASAGAVDISEIDEAGEQANQATMELNQLNDVVNTTQGTQSVAAPAPMVQPATVSLDAGEIESKLDDISVAPIAVRIEPIVPSPLIAQPSVPIRVSTQWQSPSNIEVLSGSGISQYGQEINEAGEPANQATMELNQLNDVVNATQGTESVAAPMVQPATVSLDAGEIESKLNDISVDPIAVRIEPIVPSPLIAQPSVPIRVPTQWQSPSNIEVFSGSGIARYGQEVSSANQMLTQVTQNQQHIVSMSNRTNLFPDSMIADLQTMNTRIERLKLGIERIESNPIDNIGADAINQDVEALRSQLAQALNAQNDLTNAMQQMDVSAANAAYDRLNRSISATDTNIRQNIIPQVQSEKSDKGGESKFAAFKDKAVEVASAGMEGLGKAFEISDTFVQAAIKLDLMNDGLQSTDDLQKMVYLAAERSRSSFEATADVVATLGQGAGAAFSSSAETIQFAENLNKQFLMAGASQEEITSAAGQLSQALGSGVLRGDDLNSVFESAPNAIQTIADYMGVPVGQLTQMADAGQVTAEIVKNAMIGATDEINQKFGQIPALFSQIKSGIQNDALMAFQPLFMQLNALINSPAFGQLIQVVTDVIAAVAGIIVNFMGSIDFQSIIAGITDALSVVAGIIIGIFGLVAQVAGFISDNWSILLPIILGVATALGIYAAALVVYNAIQAITTGIEAARTLQAAVQAAALNLQSGATFVATAQMYGFNAALLACPLTWIIVAIIAIIAVIYAVVAAVNKFTGASVSATGIICGVFATLLAFIGNILVGLVNLIVGLFATLLTFIASFANFFANVFEDPVGAIARLFFDLVDTLLSLFETIANAIDTIFGSNLAGAVQGWRDDLGGWVDGKFGKGKEVVTVSEDIQGLERFNYGDAGNKGYEFGAGVDDKISNFDPSSWFSSNTSLGENMPTDGLNSDFFNEDGSLKDNIGGDLFNQDGSPKDGFGGDLFNEDGSLKDGLGSDFFNQGGSPTDGLGSDFFNQGGYPSNGLDNSLPNAADFASAEVDTVPSNVGSIAEDTAGIKDAVNISSEDIQLLRDIAERQAINQYTTAEIKVEMTNNNSISNEMDLDGVVNMLEFKVAEVAAKSAEGVHV